MRRPLRILIDARMLLGRFSGVARMVTNLVETLAQVPELHVTVLCGNEPHEPWKTRKDLSLLISDFSRRDRSPLRRAWWEAVHLPRWIARSGADVWHATWNTGVPPFCAIPTLLTVHDLIPWHEPVMSVSSRLERIAYRRSIRASVSRARRIMTVSGYTADQLTQCCRINPEKIRVIYNGVSSASADRPEHSPVGPYVLYVGGHEPRKNVETILAAMTEYWRSYDATLKLRLTGRAGDLAPEARAAFERLDRDSRIEFLGSPSDTDLTREYSGASALLMLSRAEGFGLPVMEAMAAGCPVIAAGCGSLPEIVGDAGILVEMPQSNALSNSIVARNVASVIHRIRSDAQFTREMTARAHARADRFTWSRAAAAYLDEYRRCDFSRTAASTVECPNFLPC